MSAPSVPSLIPTNVRSFYSPTNFNGTYVPWRARLAAAAGEQARPCGGCGACGSCRGEAAPRSADAPAAPQSAAYARHDPRAMMAGGLVYGTGFSGTLNDPLVGSQTLPFNTPSDAANAVRDRMTGGESRLAAEDRTLLDIFTLATASLRERQLLVERNPGNTGPIASGEIVNAIVGDLSIPIAVGDNGDFFGEPFTGLSMRRLAELNGWGPNTVTSLSLAGSGALTGLAAPVPDGCFIIDLVSAQLHPWANRIYQTANNVAVETQGLALAVNGCAGRIIWLVRRPQPYYFYFRNQRLNPNFPGDACALDTSANGFYFTSDPTGGNQYNTLNGAVEDPDNPGTILPGTMPPIFGDASRVVYPIGQPVAFVVDNSWPSMLFYQSLSAPYMGGMVFVVGQY